MVDVVTSSRCLLALYTKLRTGSCLTHVGREGLLHLASVVVRLENDLLHLASVVVRLDTVVFQTVNVVFQMKKGVFAIATVGRLGRPAMWPLP